MGILLAHLVSVISSPCELNDSGEHLKCLDGRTTVHGYIIVSSLCELSDSGEHLKGLDGRTMVHGYTIISSPNDLGFLASMWLK